MLLALTNIIYKIMVGGLYIYIRDLDYVEVLWENAINKVI